MLLTNRQKKLSQSMLHQMVGCSMTPAYCSVPEFELASLLQSGWLHAIIEAIDKHQVIARLYRVSAQTASAMLN